MIERYHVRGLRWEGAPDGAIIYFIGEIAYLLPIPGDWNEQNEAGTPYVLGIGAGRPRWRTSTLAPVEGVMQIESEPSGESGPLRDADGNLMYGYPV